MIGVLRAEWIKLRSLRMNVVLTFLAVLAPLLIPALVAALGKVRDLDSRQLYDTVAGATVLSSFLWSVLGATHITNEFGFNTIRSTFAATPRRIRVVAAKLIVLAVCVVVVQGATTVAGLNLAESIATNRGANIDYSTIDGFWPAAVGIVLFAGLVTLFGFTVGLILRSSPAAVAFVVLWPLLGENLLSSLLSVAGVDKARKWMPYASGLRLWSIDSESESFGRLPSGLYFAGVVLLLLVLGTVLTQRRDA